MRHQQPRIRKIRTQKRRAVPERLRRRHPVDQKGHELGRTVTDEMDQGQRVTRFTQIGRSFGRIFKAAPYVPDKGIESIVKDLANQRPVAKEFIGHPELFRDNGPLERALPRS